MDTTTLVVANGLLFALYAGVMLVNARIVGGARGAMWFAASNLLRGTSMIIVGIEWLHLVPTRYASAMSAVLAVVGAMMLHQAFAELLERGEMMRGVQYVLVAAMTVVATLLMMIPSLNVLLGVVLCGVLSAQFLVIALLVYRFSGEEVGPAGRLTSLALGAYSITFLARAYTSSSLGVTLIDMQPWMMKTWLIICLMTTAATAFGFMSLSTARLRVELLWRAQVDELTGLLNRWALKRLVMREIDRCHHTGHSLNVVMLDLDGLKLVNDTRGHTCGDVVLQAVAGVLQETVREQDSAARMGGDEFCVLLPETSVEEARNMAERLRQEIDELVIQYRGETVRTRASLGIACSAICGLSWQSLMDCSDSALYRAKGEGRNRVVIAGAGDSPVMKKAATSVSQLIEEQAP
jgi:diguanylate cyclase (GGDEF)-like protein